MMASNSTSGNHRQRAESSTSGFFTPNIHVSDVSDRLHPSGEGRKQEDEETSKPGDRLLDAPSSSGFVMPTDENKEMIITSIRATDVALGLGRIPAGFYAVVNHSDLEWRTENKRVSTNNGDVEWSEPIPIPCNLSSTVEFKVYASFELQPPLGSGEQLRELIITVEQILNCSEKSLPFTFIPKDGDVVSPCSSLVVSVSEQQRQANEPSVSRVIDPYSSTTKSQDQLESATNQGHNSLLRYQKYGEKRDLERSVEEFERALTLCPMEHPCRAAVQSNIAMAKFIHCQVNDTDLSLDVPLTLYRNALSARPSGHPDRPSTLIKLAAVHFARFHKWGHEVDAAQVKELLDEAKNVCSAENHESQAAISMLQLHAERETAAAQVHNQSLAERDSAPDIADDDPLDLSVQLVQRFERFGVLDDLQHAISILEAFVFSTSTWETGYLAGLRMFGVAFLYRFECLGEIGDLEQAISKFRDAVELAPTDHPDKPTCLNNLGNSSLTRFHRIGQLGDLEQAIARLRDAVDLTPDGHPDKPGRLSNLGNSLLAFFERIGELSDLEEAISIFREAVDLTPDGHPDKPPCLNNLGNSFFTRFHSIGQLDDLEEAIARFTGAVDLTPADHPDKPYRLNNLGTSFLTRFEYSGQLSDLERAVSTLGDAVYLTPDDHPQQPTSLNNLGNSLLTRFRRIGQLSDLEQGISRLRDAVSLTPDGHPDKLARLNNLGTSLVIRFEHTGQLDDLEEAIPRLRDAVDLTPDGHPYKPRRLNSLGNSLRSRFECVGQLGDLEDAISRLEDADALTPDGHPEKPARLNNLGISFKARFDSIGRLSDLEQAISKFRDAVDLTPDGHTSKPGRLSNLGTSFRARFESIGQLSDLEQAISRFRDAVDLTPDDHPDKPGRLDNLGNSFLTRFERIEQLNDLEEAISKLKDAVELTPDDHDDKPYRLNNLGNSFLTHFKRIGQVSDLEQAISRLRDAVHLTPDDHPDKPFRLDDLGTSFLDRFQCIGQLDDLEEAISKLKDAVDLTPDDHLDKAHQAHRLNNLSNSLLVRFERIGQLGDLDQAISMLRGSVDLTPDDDPLKPDRLNNLGHSFRARFQRIQQLDDLDQAISVYSHVACAHMGAPTTRFSAANNWISCARVLEHPSLLHSYSCAIDLLPQIAWIGTHPYHELRLGIDVVREAAAAALSSGRLKTAIEWLEQGRLIIWGDLFQIRGSSEALASVHPEHARRLRQLSTELNHASANREKPISLLFGRTHSAGHGTDSLEQATDKDRTLTIEWDGLLQEIRRLPGFERFLLHKEFSQFRASAHSGPVVILNATESRCDALIVPADADDVVHAPLPGFSVVKLEELQTLVQSLLRQKGLNHANEWKYILSTLWTSVVWPVVDALGFSTSGNPSRIFWCPTGPFTFLPVHAAGLYDEQYSQPGHKLSDFAVSSYVPTLSVLAPPPEHDATSGEDLRLLAVPQPPSDGLRLSPGVDDEPKRIKTIIQTSPSARTIILESSTGTVEEVLELMKEADWVHFACQGVQDDKELSLSGFYLADRRRLTLTDMTALSRPRGGLAFLSACETAMGYEPLSDEAFHIAAGMLFAGYHGVVATMWSISDKKVLGCVVEEVYERLFRNGTRPDSREAARALQDAAVRVRDNGASFVEWLPFIHVGI